MENYWRQSPLKYVGNVTTPTLVMHSEADQVCPIEQSEQLYVALKKMGVETEMVLYPEEPHPMASVARTDRRIDRLNHMRRWFGRYLGVEDNRDQGGAPSHEIHT